jgi:hypothetical protein
MIATPWSGEVQPIRGSHGSLTLPSLEILLTCLLTIMVLPARPNAIQKGLLFTVV